MHTKDINPARTTFGIQHEYNPSGRPVGFIAMFARKAFICVHCGGQGESTTRNARYCHKKKCQKARERANLEKKRRTV